jgi:hypothetical protein
MLVLEGEQGSAAPGVIERALLDHAYGGHANIVTALRCDRQRHVRCNRCGRGHAGVRSGHGL